MNLSQIGVLCRPFIRGSLKPLYRTVLVAGTLFMAALPAAGTFAASGPTAAQTNCQQAGSTGLTAKVVATSGQTITGLVDATGCDVGIYVGPGVSNVTIQSAVVENADNHGIFVQDAFGTTIENSVVDHNGLNPTLCPNPPQKPTGPCISEDKPIELVGTSHSVVENNTVTGNLADGGIGVADDGPLDPGAFDPGTLKAAYHNVIANNVVVDNKGGCGIVLAAYNQGGGVSNNVVTGNVVNQNVAGVVVAADSPGTTVINNDVFRNVVEDNIIPGIIVHSNTPGDKVIGTNIQGNVLSGNGADGEVHDTATTGIIVVTNPTPPGFPAGTPAALITYTTVKGNTFDNEQKDVVVTGKVQALRH